MASTPYLICSAPTAATAALAQPVATFWLSRKQTLVAMCNELDRSRWSLLWVIVVDKAQGRQMMLWFHHLRPRSLQVPLQLWLLLLQLRRRRLQCFPYLRRCPPLQYLQRLKHYHQQLPRPPQRLWEHKEPTWDPARLQGNRCVAQMARAGAHAWRIIR